MAPTTRTKIVRQRSNSNRNSGSMADSNENTYVQNKKQRTRSRTPTKVTRTIIGKTTKRPSHKLQHLYTPMDVETNIDRGSTRINSTKPVLNSKKTYKGKRTRNDLMTDVDNVPVKKGTSKTPWAKTKSAQNPKTLISKSDPRYDLLKEDGTCTGMISNMGRKTVAPKKGSERVVYYWYNPNDEKDVRCYTRNKWYQSQSDARHKRQKKKQSLEKT